LLNRTTSTNECLSPKVALAVFSLQDEENWQAFFPLFQLLVPTVLKPQAREIELQTEAAEINFGLSVHVRSTDPQKPVHLGMKLVGFC
jgi:hypothetical protein